VIILDALLVLLLVPFAFNGWRRGLCREGFDLVGVVGGLVVAAAVAPAGTAFLARQGVPPIAALPIALSAALIATMLVARVVGGIVAQAVHAVYLGPLDRGAGVFFAALKGAACLGLVLMILDRFAATPGMQMAIQGSVLGPQLMRVALSALEIGRQVSSGAGGI
jgi:membrane protein required for colicin V production